MDNWLKVKDILNLRIKPSPASNPYRTQLLNYVNSVLFFSLRFSLFTSLLQKQKAWKAQLSESKTNSASLLEFHTTQSRWLF